MILLFERGSVYFIQEVIKRYRSNTAAKQAVIAASQNDDNDDDPGPAVVAE
jgi:heme-binding NEAT domain protein